MARSEVFISTSISFRLPPPQGADRSSFRINNPTLTFMDVCKFDPLSIELKERLLPLEICICIQSLKKIPQNMAIERLETLYTHLDNRKRIRRRTNNENTLCII